MRDRLEIEELINITSGRKLEILLRLRELNQSAYFFMMQFGKRWKQKYHEMWKQPFWIEAKQLLKEYYTIENNGILKCKICGLEINNQFTLHHNQYNMVNCFNPLFCDLIHLKCHTRTYSKRSYKKRKK